MYMYLYICIHLIYICQYTYLDPPSTYIRSGSFQHLYSCLELYEGSRYRFQSQTCVTGMIFIFSHGFPVFSINQFTYLFPNTFKIFPRCSHIFPHLSCSFSMIFP